MTRNRGSYWQVRVYAGPDLLTGKSWFLYDRAPTKREAERLEARLTTEVADGRHQGTGGKTVTDLVERWYAWRQAVRPIFPTTLEGYRRQIDQRILPALGRLPVRQLDAATLDAFYAELRRRGGRGRHAQQPLSPSTVRAVHTVLSGSLKQAVAWGWVSQNAARLATPPALQPVEVRPPTTEDGATRRSRHPAWPGRRGSAVRAVLSSNSVDAEPVVPGSRP